MKTNDGEWRTDEQRNRGTDEQMNRGTDEQRNSEKMNSE